MKKKINVLLALILPFLGYSQCDSAKANFSYEIIDMGYYELISFDNLSTDDTLSIWHFGDGQIDSIINPTNHDYRDSMYSMNIMCTLDEPMSWCQASLEIILIVQNGCSVDTIKKTIDVRVCCDVNTSIEEVFDSLDFSYSNNLITTSYNKEIILSLYNLKGEIIDNITLPIGQNYYSTEGLISGIYIFKFKTTDKEKTLKVLIK